LSSIRSLRTTGRGSGGIPLRTIALVAAVAALGAAALAAPAGAALSAVGPVNPRTGFPDWYQDSGGLKLSLCLDGLPLCSAAAGDLVAPDGEAFYWRAQGDLTSGSLTAKLALGQEAAFAGGPVTFGRVRATIVGARPNTAYRVRHPFGTMTITTDAGGIGKSTTDVGCGASPCDWTAALGSALGPFLHWDPTVAPLPAPGYIGDAATPHRVVGSPTGFNGFSVTGGGVALSTNLLTVEGKLAGPAVPDIEVVRATDFGTTTTGAPVQRTVTITNLGVPDAAGRSNLTFGPIGIAGPEASAFALVGDSCGGRAIPSGQSCQLTLQFNPVAAGSYNAGLTINHNSVNGQTGVALNGVVASPAAVAAAAAAAAAARSGLALRTLRMTHRLTRARVLRRGLRVTMRLPQGTELVKVAIFRVRSGKLVRKPVWVGFRLVNHTGLYRLSLGSRALRRRLKAGLYQVNVTPGVTKRQLGRTSTTRIRVTRD
jgi:hypothetical protein